MLKVSMAVGFSHKNPFLFGNPPFHKVAATFTGVVPTILYQKHLASITKIFSEGYAFLNTFISNFVKTQSNYEK